MTYNVSMGTLNPTIPTILYYQDLASCIVDMCYKLFHCQQQMGMPVAVIELTKFCDICFKIGQISVLSKGSWAQKGK